METVRYLDKDTELFTVGMVTMYSRILIYYDVYKISYSNKNSVRVITINNDNNLRSKMARTYEQPTLSCDQNRDEKLFTADHKETPSEINDIYG